MKVKEAWNLGYSGKGVVVSILDDGLQKAHPDLAENYVIICTPSLIKESFYFHGRFFRIQKPALILTATMTILHLGMMIITSTKILFAQKLVPQVQKATEKQHEKNF